MGLRALAEPDTYGRLGVAVADVPVSGRLDANTVGWLLLDGGAGRLSVDATTVDVPARSRWCEPGWSALLGPGAAFAVEGDLHATLVWRVTPARTASRLLDPADAVVEERGEGSTRRTVRTYLADGPLVCGETLNPPGGWSSYPPHRHDQEEVYLYRFDPPHGFGVAACYDADGAREPRPQLLRDGDLTRITHGYHPVVAAPDAAMYYLWAIAGRPDTRTDPTYTDGPHHAPAAVGTTRDPSETP
jgi:5-deoxy-D-glucuronate isomerase